MAMDYLRFRSKCVILVYESPAVVAWELSVDTEDQFADLYKVNRTYAFRYCSRQLQSTCKDCSDFQYPTGASESSRGQVCLHHSCGHHYALL